MSPSQAVDCRLNRRSLADLTACLGGWEPGRLTDRLADWQTGEVGIETVDQQAREVEGGRAQEGEARRGSGWIAWRAGAGEGKMQRQCNADCCFFLVRFSVPGLELAGLVWLARNRRQSWQLR